MFNQILGKIQEWKAFYTRNERRVSSAALLAGFIIDSLTLQRIDLAFEQIVLLSHLLVAAAGIAYINVYEAGTVRIPAGRVGRRIAAAARSWMPLFVQFSFGALFSGFFIFYSRSASLAGSWPFLLILLALLIGNDFFRERYQRLIFQISIFYFALFSFSIFYVPIVVGRIGTWVFLLSGVVSIALLALFVRGLAVFIPARIAKSKPFIIASVAGIFLLVNMLYFLNVIPPIPLALKEADVAHAVEHSGGGYRITDEEEPWYSFLLPFETIHVADDGQVAFYSAVFAPTDLKTSIVHEWQYYDETHGEWITDSRVSFPIVGGRDGGYRGYSVKLNVFPARWRVDVETTGGQILGRTEFRVKATEKPVEFTIKHRS